MVPKNLRVRMVIEATRGLKAFSGGLRARWGGL
jgi:hypothetical protein